MPLAEQRVMQQVYECLRAPVRTREDLLHLFVRVLGFMRVEMPLPAQAETFGTGKALELARECQPMILAAHGDFKIIYAELEGERLDYGRQRLLVTPLLRVFPEALFVFARKATLGQAAGAEVHLVSVKGEASASRRVFRRFRLGPGERYRTTAERLALLQVSSASISTLELRQRLDAAFDVEAVTEKFFEDYKKVFAELQKFLFTQTGDKRWAHDYALQLLNRLMFLYFIQRKGWLGGNLHFMADFWRAYKASGQPPNSFFKRWLSVLFFEAFNKKFHGGHRHFPKEIFSALMRAPYLNGGLFKENELDRKYAISIRDEFFSQLLEPSDEAGPGFLERYNFTIAESTPLDIEVAVDPEMIGKIYESLVNITFEGITEEDRRGLAGIFYTPRVEIDLMCRLALVDTLANYLGQDKKPLLYDAVFAYDEADKQAADSAIKDQDLWPELDRLLRDITVCDPACGSGSFLVGMLLVLDDLQARANFRVGREETPYARRRRIISEQLYGVDVMEWAVHVAELRLWLQLIIETQLHPSELQFDLRPLLPNLSFKVRCGDSLVQEIGGVNFGLHRHRLDIPTRIKGEITKLKSEKLRFCHGEESLREEDLKAEELKVFCDILDHNIKLLQERVKSLRHNIASIAEQSELPGVGTGKGKQQRLQLEAQWRAELQEGENKLQQLRQAREKLTDISAAPFVWDIAFVEIFEGRKQGFDIVIGNPPYVRQEKIAPPGFSPADFGGEHSDRWKEQKKAYKAKLQHSVAAAWPKFFRYQPGQANFRKLEGKSDLYIYFYLHGLSLLNPKGSFCFITSNSWLDVGYGRDLQEFLLRHSHIKFILDNERKRSFAQADVNTVIVLLAPPDDRTDAGLDKTARFVLFKVPFEDVATAETFKALEAVADRASSDRWRCTVRSQRELYEESLERDEDDELAAKAHTIPIQTPHYQAGKWGGKYLRAPDIFFTILEKGKGKLVRLGDIAEVRFGIKTGANEFFYLEPTGKPAPAGYIHVRNGAGWEGELEEEFLQPVIKSPRECRTIVIKPEDLRYKIFLCHKDKSDLKGTAALEYIKWGESQGYHLRPTCRGRQRWWDVGIRSKARINLNYLVDETMRFFLKEDGFFVSDNFQEWHISSDTFWQAGVTANSTVFQLFANIAGRANFGGGLMKIQTYEVAAIETLSPTTLDAKVCRQVLERADRLELNSFDRRALDEVVFDVLGLTPGEREA
ncbi:MAG: Eco57I restriction-modification methylase domain-containing protein, partial [Bacteroidia bacterium]|nr:Eco57I restriction-modification methylase domain-containing protein [Bacteroidia bacterium]